MSRQKVLRSVVWAFVAAFVVSALAGCSGHYDPEPSNPGGDPPAGDPPGGDPPGGDPPEDPPSSNAPPVADAGADQTVLEGATVQLAGQGTDPDGTITAYAWEQMAGPEVTLSDPQSAAASFATPVLETDEVITFRLTVTDDAGDTGTDTVSITVDHDDPPAAAAGEDFTVVAQRAFTLDSSATTDDRELASVSWAQVAGMPLTPEPTADPSRATFVAPEVFQPATVEFELTATDNTGQTATDRVVVTVNPPLPDLNRFLAYLNQDSPVFQETQETATAYYAAVDPLNQKTTLEDWKRANGFDEGFDARAIYRNAADLGFGRAMYMRTNGDGTVASYVENYTSLDEAILAVDAAVNDDVFATVAMEHTSHPVNGGDRYVTFYVFGPDGERLLAADLDGRGAKFVPGVCNVCHGGQPVPLVDGQYPNNGDTQAQFLPWDVDSFEFAGFDPRFTRSALEPELKKLNAGALSTYPTTPEPGRWTGAAARELIEGWYGGPGMPSDTFDGSFTPGGWLPDVNGNPADSEELYHEVVARNCRACHVQRGTSLQNAIDFGSYQKFAAFRERTRQLVFEQGVMPVANLTFDNFWNRFQNVDSASRLAAYLEVDTNTRLPGIPVADPGPARMVSTNQTLVLDGNASAFATTFNWSLQTRPNGSAAALANALTATPTLTTDAPGLYRAQLVVSNVEGETSPAATVDLIAVANLVTPTFNEPGTGIGAIIGTRCVACHVAGGPYPGIPVLFDDVTTRYDEVIKYVNREQPAASPIVAKPSNSIPHGGGRVAGFEPNGGLNDYDRFIRWILEGAQDN